MLFDEAAEKQCHPSRVDAGTGEIPTGSNLAISIKIKHTYILGSATPLLGTYPTDIFKCH